jgi:hypothetical protein
MSSSVKDILSKTNQQFGLLDDDRKIAFAREMSGWKGWKMAFMGKLKISDFRTMIEGKRLIQQQNNHQKH